MQRVMGTSGAESTNVAASIFMGQTEAPLTIRPFLAGLTQSELFTVMASGMAHVSGAVMAAYVRDRACRDPAPADGGDHDRAGDDHARQDADAGDGQAGHGGERRHRGREAGREHHRCGARGARATDCIWR